MSIKESILQKLKEVEDFMPEKVVNPFVENAKALYSYINTACAIFGIESSNGDMFLIRDNYLTMDVLASIRFSNSNTDECVVEFLEKMNANVNHYDAYFAKEMKFFKTLFVYSVTRHDVCSHPHKEYQVHCNPKFVAEIDKYINFIALSDIDPDDEDLKYNAMVVESIYSTYIKEYFKDKKDAEIYSNYKCALNTVKAYTDLEEGGLIAILAGMNNSSKNVMRNIINSIPIDATRKDIIENHVIDMLDFIMFGCDCAINSNVDKGAPFRFVAKIIGKLNHKKYMTLKRNHAFLYKILGFSVEMSTMSHNLNPGEIFNSFKITYEDNCDKYFTIDMLGTEIGNSDVEINEEFCFRLLEVIDNIYNVSVLSLHRIMGFLDKRMYDCVKCIRGVYDMKAILNELEESGEDKYKAFIKAYHAILEMDCTNILASLKYHNAEECVDEMLKIFDDFSKDVSGLLD